MFIMQLRRSSTLSGHIKLVFLILAVLVVLVQAFGGRRPKPCLYGLGLCRSSCEKNENERKKCKNGKTCCTEKMRYPAPQPSNTKVTGKPKPRANNLKDDAHFPTKKRQPSQRLY